MSKNEMVTMSRSIIGIMLISESSDLRPARLPATSMPAMEPPRLQGQRRVAKGSATAGATRSMSAGWRRASAVHPGWIAGMALAVGSVAGCGDRTGLLVPLPAEPPAPSSNVGPGCGPCSFKFVSDPSWASYSGLTGPSGDPLPLLGASLGPARDVCASKSAPPNCPGDAVVYGFPGAVWEASSGLSSARWIWRADVSPQSPADLRAVAFAKTFTVGNGASGTIEVAADDFAAVFVNGTEVGTTGSIASPAKANAAQRIAATFNLTTALVAGSDTIVVFAQNGPTSFANGCGSAGCTYAQNPAGVVFAGSVQWP
jgi:hypothetical protein